MTGRGFGHADQAEFRVLRDAHERGGAFLVFRDGLDRLVVTHLEPGDSPTLGRQEGCTVHLVWDTRVSRVHAGLEWVAGDWWLVDAGRSLNGSFVNGLRVDRRARLSDGDVVRLGGVELLYRRPAGARSGRTEVTGPASALAMRAPLTARERDILAVLCEGMDPVEGGVPASNPRIAEALGMEVPNVKAALTVLFQKFGLARLEPSVKRVELARAAMLEGLGRPPRAPDGR